MRPSKLRFPRKHRGHDQVLFGDGVGDLSGQRAGVADAGGAAVADQVKAQLVQIRRQAGLLQILGHDHRAGSQRGLDPGSDLQPALDRLLGQQAGGHQQRRVGGVGATGDGGDHYAAVPQSARDIAVDFFAGGGGVSVLAGRGGTASLAFPAALQSWRRAAPGFSSEGRLVEGRGSLA